MSSSSRPTGMADSLFSLPTPMARLRKQPLACLCVLDEDRADRTILCGFENLRLGVGHRVHHLGLTIIIEPERLRCNRLAHGVADAGLMIHPDLQFPSHVHSPSAR